MLGNCCIVIIKRFLYPVLLELSVSMETGGGDFFFVLLNVTHEFQHQYTHFFP